MSDPTAVVIVVSGETVTPFARVGRLRISDVLNDAPNTAALTLVYTSRVGPAQSGAFAAHAFDAGGFATATNQRPILVPPPMNPGAPIGIYLGSVDPATQIFGGQILTREQYAEYDRPEHVRYDVSCVDFTRRLNRRKVLKAYGQQSATAIVLDLVATFAPDITTAHVAPGLATITGGMTFTFEEVSRALSRIAEKLGAYWYVDYVGDLHFFADSEPGTEPAPLVPGADFANFRVSADLSQVRTRVLVEGDGATVLGTLAAGSAILPISQSLPFNAAGGRAKVGETRITYTGLQAGTAKANTVGVGSGGTPPPAAPAAPTAALAPVSTLGGLSGGPYQYAVTLELADGARSDVGPKSAPVSIVPAGGAPPTSSGGLDPAAPGPILPNHTATYATTFVAGSGSAAGETGGTMGGTVLLGRPVGPPGSVYNTATPVGGGALTTSHWYALSYLVAGGGETAAVIHPTYAQLTGGYSALQLNLITFANDNRVIGRRLYRAHIAGFPSVVAPPWRHVVDIMNNDPNVNYVDGVADADLPVRTLPTWSTAGGAAEAAIVSLAVSGDPRVTRRRLYRKDDDGEYKLVTEIPNNTTTTYTDRSAVGSGGAMMPTTSTITTGAVQVSNIPLGPAGTARRRLFRTSAGGTELRELVQLADNVTTSYVDGESDATLGGSPLPSQGGGGGTTAPPTSAGSGYIQIDDLTGFPASGWVLVGEQLIRYTATSASGGFFLVGIPGSGVGAIAADIPAGTVLTAAPALVGVAPVVAVTLGDAVQLIAQVDDVPAQQAIAAIEGGDGVIEHYIQDRRLSESGAIARGRAELELFKTIETQLSYTTHDPETRSGRTVHVDLPAPTNITGDFLIQRVTIDDVSYAKNFYPRRSVDASTTRFSFDDVLNRMILEQT